MINASKKIISLSIFEKLGTVQRYKVCDLETIDNLVTELEPSNERLYKYHKQGLEIL